MSQVTSAERERLVKLVEELSEAIKAAAKVLNHDWTSHWNENIYDNRANLERELGDVQACQRLLTRKRNLSLDEIQKQSILRVPDFLTRMHHQHEDDRLLDPREKA